MHKVPVIKMLLKQQNERKDEKIADEKGRRSRGIFACPAGCGRLYE